MDREERLQRVSFRSFHRHADQQAADHGEAGAGHVRALQPGGSPGRTRAGHQQEAVAGDHQGSEAALLHHISRLHSKNTVSYWLLVLVNAIVTPVVNFGLLS